MTNSDKRATRIAALGVAVVAVTAAIISFSHVHSVAIRTGETELTSWLLPISIDGAVVAAVSVLLADSRAGRRPRPLTWLLLALGLLSSLAANVAAAEPTGTARVVAAWPPLALVLGIEVLAGLARRVDPHGVQARDTSELVMPAGNDSNPIDDSGSRRCGLTAADAINGDGNLPERPPTLKDSAALAVIRQLDRSAPTGRVSRFTIQAKLGCGGSRAARLADLARRSSVDGTI
jgi:hypothetical protein